MLSKNGQQGEARVADIVLQRERIRLAFQATPFTGLSHDLVKERQDNNRINICPKNSSSILAIFQRNLFNVFNFVNFLLAFFILWAASYNLSYLKNGLFMGVVVSNLFIAISQELKAKFILDKLSILLNPEITVRRNGQEVKIMSNELVQNDLFLVESGLQLPVDGIVCKSDELTVDEALLTGEADNIIKKKNDMVFAGTICKAGSAWVEACLLGQDSFANQITLAAKQAKEEKSELRLGLNRLIKILAALILPLGSLLFLKNYWQNMLLAQNLVLTVAALIGMIPEGLILLCEVAFAVATLKLAKVDCLVQHVSAVEMLARTDVLCLDKTGTITTGAMSLQAVLALEAAKFCKLDLTALVKYMLNLNKSSNLTATAILQAYKDVDTAQVKHALGEVRTKLAFSSERKYQAVTFEAMGTFYLGASEFILAKQGLAQPLQDKLDMYSKEAYRVLMLAWQKNQSTVIEPLALLLLSDEIRQDVKQTFAYFQEQGVTLKIISGDNPQTLKAIAKRANLEAKTVIDMSSLGNNPDYLQLAEKYQLFGRVSPSQKEQLVKALQAKKHIVTMTGDGVNDVPALKRADCAVSMLKGSDACRKSADLVLLANNLQALISAVYEGRRVINNIKLVASLFLHKTIYACILALFYLFSGKVYPLYPIQLTLISTLTIGIPAFALTLRSNKARLTGRFWQDVLTPSIMAACVNLSLIVAGEILLVNYDFYMHYRSLYVMLCLAASAFSLLVKVAQPLDKLKLALIASLVLACLVAVLLLPSLLNLPLLNWQSALFASLFTLFVYLLTAAVLKLVPIFTKSLS